MSARVIVEDLVDVFKTSWEAADAEGKSGERTRAGIDAVLETLLLADGDVVIGQPSEVQALVLWVGDSLPVVVEDDIDADDLRELFASPVMRAVTIARLRTIADLLEQDLSEEDE